LACCTTQSIPAITWETSELPCASATLTDTIRASGATPRKAVVLLLAVLVVTPLSWPAMMPAIWVPVPVGVQVTGGRVRRRRGQVRPVEDLPGVGQAGHRRHPGDVDTLAGPALRPHRPDVGHRRLTVVQRTDVGGGVVHGDQQLHRGVRVTDATRGVAAQHVRFAGGQGRDRRVDDPDPALHLQVAIL
jgi:hypothetical protein